MEPQKNRRTDERTDGELGRGGRGGGKGEGHRQAAGGREGSEASLLVTFEGLCGSLVRWPYFTGNLSEEDLRQLCLDDVTSVVGVKEFKRVHYRRTPTLSPLLRPDAMFDYLVRVLIIIHISAHPRFCAFQVKAVSQLDGAWQVRLVGIMALRLKLNVVKWIECWIE
ncbi:hypothetical protein Pcinc_039144 [Petrolisthes cinctipes]|uniref:Uncharacterized protein n=1 Tax=Petrolisthes cinctipes TaxID=88211 RepID=A0AAE1EM74_PETCI|nr:hypothetical protein Pcinc_039144 [Petrolisthes cinctipes]